MITPPRSPLISIVIPTRDRPQFASLALHALRRQAFEDFEVILSDNAQHRSLIPDPRLFDGVRFRYVRPPKATWMTDHWEFAVGLARGSYVGVLSDKSVLVASALEQVAAEIRRHWPDAVSWRVGNSRPSGGELDGPCVVSFKRLPETAPTRVPAAEILEYLLATYLNPGFDADHQLEIRGSIYHGIFSAALIRNMRTRFGRVFRFYAPDLTAQCAAMQIAGLVTHIDRPLELVMKGPSNGAAVAQSASQILGTQQDAAHGDSGPSPPLIANVSASIAHLLASDLMAVSGRTLRPEQRAELHVRAAFDLYGLSGWPTRSLRQSQLCALLASAARCDSALPRRIVREKWRARLGKARRSLASPIRAGLGRHFDELRSIMVGPDTSIERRSFDHLFAALAAIS